MLNNLASEIKAYKAIENQGLEVFFFNALIAAKKDLFLVIKAKRTYMITPEKT